MGTTRFQPNIPNPGVMDDARYKASFQRSMSWDKTTRIVTIDPKRHDLAAAVNQGEINTKYILLPGIHGTGAAWTLSKRCQVYGTPGAVVAAATVTCGTAGIEFYDVEFSGKVLSAYSLTALSDCHWGASVPATVTPLITLTSSRNRVEGCWSESSTPGAVGLNMTGATSTIAVANDFSLHATPISYDDADGHHLICNLGMPRDFVDQLRVYSLRGSLDRHVTVDADGDLGTGLFWDDLVVPATIVNLVGPSASPSYDSTNMTLDFSAAADNDLQFVYQMPHGWAEGTTVYFHCHWYPSNTNTGNVLWRWSYRWTNIGGVVGAWTTDSTLEAASGVTGKQVVGAILTVDGSLQKVSSILQIQLTRMGTDPSDTFTGLAKALSFDVHYQKDAPGSIPQNTKT